MNAQIESVMVTSTSDGGTMSKHMTTWGNVHLNMKHTNNGNRTIRTSIKILKV